ncbi:MAG: hypothetical protein RIS94_987 [Pseudomonadota bacterium]
MVAGGTPRGAVAPGVLARAGHGAPALPVASAAGAADALVRGTSDEAGAQAGRDSGAGHHPADTLANVDAVMNRALAIADAATISIGAAVQAVRSAAALVGAAVPGEVGAASAMLPSVHPRDTGALALRPFRRVAIVHYWLVTMRGGERVLERLLRLFPEADIFTHVYDPAGVSDLIRARTVRTSFIQKLPFARTRYQSYLPLMPMALEQLDLRGYDLVISSESGPAKGVICAPDALHLCYVHSPMRYLWDHYHDYREATGLVNRLAMPLLCHRLRQWEGLCLGDVQ